MEDKELADFLLEYGFVNEEQIESAYRMQKALPAKMTLGQILVRDGTITIRALKTIHAAYARRKEQEEREQLRGSSFTRFGKPFEKKEVSKKTKVPAKTPEIKKEEKKPATVKPAKKSDKPETEPTKETKPVQDNHVMLKALRSDMDLLEKQVSFLREDVKLLRRWVEHEIMLDIRSYVRKQIEELRKTGDSQNAQQPSP